MGTVNLIILKFVDNLMMRLFWLVSNLIATNTTTDPNFALETIVNKL